MKATGRWKEGNWLEPIRLSLPVFPSQGIQNNSFDILPLQQALAEIIPVFRGLTDPLNQVKDWFAEGRFYSLEGKSLSGTEASTDYQTVLFHRPVADLSLVPSLEQPGGQLNVLWENPVAVVVDKPGNLATMPRGRYVARSVVWLARRQWENPNLVAAHRLDRLTSGCLLLIKDPAWRRAYQQLFDQRKVEKTYQAWTYGRQTLPQPGSRYIWKAELSRSPGRLSANLHRLWQIEDSVSNPGNERETLFPGEGKNIFPPAPNSFNPSNSKILDSTNITAEKDRIDSGKYPGKQRKPNSRDKAEKKTCTLTSAEVISADPETRLLYWQLKPKTGFFHQLRAVLSGAGFPIIGDPLYPEENLNLLGDPDNQLSLRATKLSFPDPYSRKTVTICASDLPTPMTD